MLQIISRPSAGKISGRADIEPRLILHQRPCSFLTDAEECTVHEQEGTELLRTWYP